MSGRIQTEFFGSERQPAQDPSEKSFSPEQASGEPGAVEEKKVDTRNTLNDLTGSQWLPETKSFFFQKGLGATHPHAQIERQHPAPFSFQDIQRLVAFFTKAGQVVLDPFSGVGSTAKACALLGRKSVGIELSPRWHKLAVERLETEIGPGESKNHELIQADVREVLPRYPDNTFHFVVTSPPYWSILNKKADHKAMERVRQDLATRYSDDPLDMGNVPNYSDFLTQLVAIFAECGRVLKPKRYMPIVVSDFRHRSRLYAFHSDLIQRMQDLQIQPKHRLVLQGVKALLQNHKSLKPYGYPSAYVENIHHQYILIFRKSEQARSK